MWRDYFGPKARIIGIDLNPNAKKWEKEGFEIFIGSQSDERFWQEVVSKVGNVDVVVDDGGHTYEQQIITVECLLGAINDGGLILVEDTHTSYMSGFGPKKFSYINYVKNKIDQINSRYGFEQTKLKTERRVCSIEIRESMVAFKIDRAASNEISKLTTNKGIDDFAVDFRHVENDAITKLDLIADKLKILKRIPFCILIYSFVRNTLANRKFKARNYF